MCSEALRTIIHNTPCIEKRQWQSETESITGNLPQYGSAALQIGIEAITTDIEPQEKQSQYFKVAIAVDKFLNSDQCSLNKKFKSSTIMFCIA